MPEGGMGGQRVEPMDQEEEVQGEQEEEAGGAAEMEDEVAPLPGEVEQEEVTEDDMAEFAGLNRWTLVPSLSYYLSGNLTN